MIVRKIDSPQFQAYKFIELRLRTKASPTHGTLQLSNFFRRLDTLTIFSFLFSTKHLIERVATTVIISHPINK